MNHQQATDLLPAFAAGELDAGPSGAVESHLEGCDRCRGWLDSYQALASGLAVTGATAAPHPDSDLMALYSVEPEELDPGARRRLTRHLADCPDCRQTIRRAREALLEAKEPAAPPQVAPFWRRIDTTWSRALAAGLLIALGTVVALYVTRSSPSPKIEIAARTIHGTELIEGDRHLLASDLNLGSGSDVTLRAREVVALGNGFAVSAGGKLAVQLVAEAPTTPSERRR